MTGASPSLARINDLGVSDLERVEAVFTNPDLYELGSKLPSPDKHRGGTPLKYPKYFVIAFDSLTGIYGSQRDAATALNGPFVWERIRTLVRETVPNRSDLWLPEEPPSRTWFHEARHRYLGHAAAADGPMPQQLEDLRAAFSATGVATARELGLLDPAGKGSPTRPDASRMIYHDGKAIRQLFNGAPGDTRDVEVIDPTTGEVGIEVRARRADPDVKTHLTGDNRQIHGSKFWHAETRDERPYTRVFVSVDYVPEIKGEKNSEANIAVKNLLDLRPLVPGATGAISDTALRGVHIDELQRRTGLVVMNPVAAAKVDPKTGKRTEKEGPLTTVTFNLDDGTTEDVDICYQGGRLCRIEYADDGTRFAVPLPRTMTRIIPNADGTFRTYVEYEVAHPRGGEPQTLRERTYNDPDKDSFNRAENIRQIPPGDPDYERLKGRRSDAEAANRQIDADLYLRRAHSVGAYRQLFDLIGFAFAQNSLARHRHRAHKPLAAAA